MLLLYDPTFLLVLSGVSIFGFVAATLGTFAMLNKQSLLADTISHASLPGIAFTFLCTHSTNPFLLLCGGGIAGMIGASLVLIICHETPLKKDAALGFVLSGFFGLGLVLLTVIQKSDIAQQAILNKFLFGCAATLLPQEVQLMAIAALLVLLIIFLWWKQWLIISFDPDYAHALGMRVFAWQVALTALLVIVIVLGLQTVGVVLMSTLCIAPSAAMRQWTNNTAILVWTSGCLGSFAAAIGTIASSSMSNMPTGPAIVIVASSLVLFSVLCAPRRGILSKSMQKRVQRIKMEYQ